jgi:hypothetical protein
MTTGIAFVALVAGLVAWLGQSLAFLAPDLAVRLGVVEPDEEIDPTLRVVEVRAMGLSDMLLAWTLPASALAMLLAHPAWPYLALFGAGVFVYFSAVFMLSRVYLRRRGAKVGRPSSERAAYVFGVVWIATALAMAVLAVQELSR